MCNHDYGQLVTCLLLHDLNILDGSLDLLLTLGIKCWCGLVKNQNFGVLDQSSSNSKSLFLTTRQVLNGWRTNICIKTLLKVLDKFSVCFGEYSLDVILSSFLVGVHEILLNSSKDKYRFLSHISNSLSKIIKMHICQICSIKWNCSINGIIETFNHLDDGTLARTGWSDNSCWSSSLDLEVHSL